MRLAEAGMAAALCMPERLAQDFRFHVPRNLIVNGEAERAYTMVEANDFLQDILRFHESYAHLGNSAIRVLTQPHGFNKTGITNEHFDMLVEARDLRTARPNSEVLFVGPREGSVRPESVVWLGHAITLSNIDRVYYMGAGADMIQEFTDQEKVRHIEDRLDCIRLVSTSDNLEFGLLEGTEALGYKLTEVVRQGLN